MTFQAEWQATPVLEPNEAASYHLRSLLPSINRSSRRRVAALVDKKTSSIKLPEFEQKVSQETLSDLRLIKDIPPEFSLSDGDWKINGPHFSTDGSNKIRFFRPNRLTVFKNPDHADIILGIAAVNLELYLAELAGVHDIDSDPYIEPYLIAKAEKMKQGLNLESAFLD